LAATLHRATIAVFILVDLGVSKAVPASNAPTVLADCSPGRVVNDVIIDIGDGLHWFIMYPVVILAMGKT
jgi:hypothetical protein